MHGTNDKQVSCCPVFLLALVFCCLGIIVVPFLYGQLVIENKLRQDVSLVAPGIGSNGIVIGDSVNTYFEKSGRNAFKLSKPAAPAELFKDVLHINSTARIFFDSLYYNEKNNYTLCIRLGIIVAVIGSSNNGTTIEGISLKSGISNFIFHYGNNHLESIKSGSHGMYIYQNKGIAVIDDDMNDSIDLYIVFSPKK